MSFAERKLRIKDGNTFTEVGSGKEIDRPYEWRRSLNSLSVSASRFSIGFAYSVNSANDLGRKIGDPSGAGYVRAPVVKGEVGSRVSIWTNIYTDDIKDSVLRPIPDNEDGIYVLSSTSQSKRVVLTVAEGDPEPDDYNVFGRGSYYGWCFFSDDGESLVVNVTANKESVLSLAEALSSGHVKEVTFDLSIDSFSFEIDDALAEFEHERVYFIYEKGAPAALRSIFISKSHDDLARLGDVRPSATKDDIDFERGASPSLDSLRNELARGVSMLGSIRFALWAAIAALLLSLLN